MPEGGDKRQTEEEGVKRRATGRLKEKREIWKGRRRGWRKK